jgi:glyoxylase-like metal-dependent hydrolase (beta-lactamase superfamily II)
MKVGGWDAMVLLEGTFGLDGGTMFGIVPRPLWSQRHPPDDQNRITMALRQLVLVKGTRRILVDAGIGGRFDKKQQEIYRYEPRKGGLVGALNRIGIQADEITDVIATHLHFDHVGGLLTSGGNGTLHPTFKNAKVHVQKDAWDWAQTPSEWDRGSFFHDDFAVWRKAMDLQLLSGSAEVAEGVWVQSTSGHAAGQQIVLVGQGKGSLVFCADLIPTASHIRLPYIMAYDRKPQVTLQEKRLLLEQAYLQGWLLVFEHDPLVTACCLKKEKDRVVLGEELCLNVRG